MKYVSINSYEYITKRPRSRITPNSREEEQETLNILYTLTCNQASFLFRGGKERLIQLIDYSSIASPESGLFSDRSRNKS